MGQFDSLIHHMKRKLESVKRANTPKSLVPLKLSNSNDPHSQGGLKIIKLNAIKDIDPKFKKKRRCKKK